MCVTTETRHFGRLGQLCEFEQESSTDSDQERTETRILREVQHMYRLLNNSRQEQAKRQSKARAEHSANKPLGGVALVKDITIGEEGPWDDIPARRCTLSWVHDIGGRNGAPQLSMPQLTTTECQCRAAMDAPPRAQAEAS